MKEIIDSLPGIEMPVGEVTNRLDHMWEADGPLGAMASRASQMNVVLHFGWEVTVEEARERFNALLQFSQRYPSRIIVLCPTRSLADGKMRAKLFSQCYIGESHREMCCCEALILGYLPENSGFLSNQVTVWLEPDLPRYHWFSGVPAKRIKEYFDTLLVGVRCTLYDSSVDGDTIGALEWPQPERVSDLANARLLPVRQALGQFLSGYETDKLCDGLERVVVRHCESMSGEAKRLLEWVQDCLGGCKESCDGVRFEIDSTGKRGQDFSLELEWIYSDERYFKWHKFAEGNLGEIEASLGKGNEKITTRVKPLGAEQTIAEALFF